MSILFDYDRETGITTHFDYDPILDKVHLSYTQDLTALMDRIKLMRNNEDYSKKGMKEDWWHYCVIPETIEMELHKRGLSIYNRDHFKAILKVINTEYPHLKTTTKKHA